MNSILYSSSGPSLADPEQGGRRRSYEQLNSRFCKFQQLLASYPPKAPFSFTPPPSPPPAPTPACSIPPIPLRRLSSLDFRRIISSFFHASSNSVGFGATW